MSPTPPPKPGATPGFSRLRQNRWPPGDRTCITSGGHDGRAIDSDGDVWQREGDVAAVIARGRVQRNCSPIGLRPFRDQSVGAAPAYDFDVVVRVRSEPVRRRQGFRLAAGNHHGPVIVQLIDQASTNETAYP